MTMPAAIPSDDARRRIRTRPTRDDDTVFLVGDIQGVARTTPAMLQAVGLRVEQYATPAEFFAAYRPHQAECLIASMSLTGMSGIQFHRELRSRGLPIPVIFITELEDVAVAVEAMKSGAADYLTPPISDRLVLERVHEALESHAQQPRSLVAPREERERFESLSPREREILEMVVGGLSSKQVAFELGLSKRTVDAHRAHIMKKVGAHSLADLVRMAVLHAASSNGMERP